MKHHETNRGTAILSGMLKMLQKHRLYT